eukprot:238152-Pyramimonas_sp.AAC.1
MSFCSSALCWGRLRSFSPAVVTMRSSYAAASNSSKGFGSGTGTGSRARNCGQACSSSSIRSLLLASFASLGWFARRATRACVCGSSGTCPV